MHNRKHKLQKFGLMLRTLLTYPYACTLLLLSAAPGTTPYSGEDQEIDVVSFLTVCRSNSVNAAKLPQLVDLLDSRSVFTVLIARVR